MPRAIECLARCRDGNVDIFLCRLVDRGDYFFGGRVNNLDGLAVDGFDKLIVDEPEGAVG
jgi:hypothetical protein